MGFFNRKQKDACSCDKPKEKSKPPKGVVKIKAMGLPDETGKITYYSQDGDQYDTPNVGYTQDGDIVTW